MSVTAMSRIWTAQGISPIEKLILIWVANAIGDVQYPVCIEPIGMAEFACCDTLDDVINALGNLHDKGLIHWPFSDEGGRSMIWIATGGPYLDAPYWDDDEEPARNKRVQALLERDGPGCKYCNTIPPIYHVDHVIPKSRGGPDKLHNFALACPDCNMKKGARTPEEWLGK